MTVVWPPNGAITMRTAQDVSSPTGGHCENGGTGGCAEAAGASMSRPPAAIAMTKLRPLANPVSLRLTFVSSMSLPLFPPHAVALPPASPHMDGDTAAPPSASVAGTDRWAFHPSR